MRSLPRLVSLLRRCRDAVLIAAAALLLNADALAFCGFYVGKADAELFNRASQVIIARDGDRTVISMANDYEGPLDEFALVVPVPTVLQRDQIHIGEAATFARIDAYSAPRLAEYFDLDPCRRDLLAREERSMDMAKSRLAQAPAPSNAALGVTVQAQYTVGEYDIVILSATESDGLQTWLQRNGYRLPKGAANVLAPYIRQDMKFFVAKVNLKEQARSGSTRLRPLQFAFESPKFMLPLRLGMLNAHGAQDLIVYALTRKGRVESSNYRTIKLPADMDLPVGIRSDFARFYKALFDAQAAREGHRAVFTEYFWDMGWCDPCAANPLTPAELRAAGVFWLDDAVGSAPKRAAGAAPVMLTRLHVRYTRDTFPEDLSFIETSDRQNYQTRYVLRHAYTGDANCPAAADYVRELRQRREREAQQLVSLTGWPLDEARRQAGLDGSVTPSHDGWWRRLWK